MSFRAPFPEAGHSAMSELLAFSLGTIFASPTCASSRNMHGIVQQPSPHARIVPVSYTHLRAHETRRHL
eukprot:8531416-Prorocentrum_lima.AAC.1